MVEQNLKIKEQIIELVKQYYIEEFRGKSTYKSGDRIPYAGRVFDEKELVNLVESSLEFWLTSGRYSKQFETEFAKFLNVKYCYACNSGSSANLLAFMALTSPLLGERRVNRGDEVITVAAGFPTTIAPIIQYGAIPVFVDVSIPEYNIDCTKLEEALSEKTKAVMIAHTLGNPFDIKLIKAFCKKHHLWLIEDNCDSLGSKCFIDGKWQYTGGIGDIGTSSFYPPHHMTMGEGGAVYTNDPILAKIILSLRDWGRDCCCPSGMDNLCQNRFSKQYGELPLGYDHKYVYGHFGYNLKITDMQAAIGCAQLEKLPNFIEARRANWKYLREKLDVVKDVLILPEEAEDTMPSWFGFVIGIKDTCKRTRDEIVSHLEESGIQTRMLFAGNIIKHPCFDEIRNTSAYRQIGTLDNTDFVMKNIFWIGVYPGMTKEMLEYMSERIITFIRD